MLYKANLIQLKINNKRFNKYKYKKILLFFFSDEIQIKIMIEAQSHALSKIT